MDAAPVTKLNYKAAPYEPFARTTQIPSQEKYVNQHSPLARESYSFLTVNSYCSPIYMACPPVFRSFYGIHTYQLNSPAWQGFATMTMGEPRECCEDGLRIEKRAWRKRNIWRKQRVNKAWVPKFLKPGDVNGSVEDESCEVDLAGNTTVMIKNIPNRLERNDLLNLLDEHCERENDLVSQHGGGIVSAYDFVYLPIDFHKRANKGYAFVNFTTPLGAVKASKVFHLMRWGALDLKRRDICQSKKICEFSIAKIQGKEKLIEHFRKSVFPCDKDEYLPVFFSRPRDGSLAPPPPHLVGKRVAVY